MTVILAPPFSHGLDVPVWSYAWSKKLLHSYSTGTVPVQKEVGVLYQYYSTGTFSLYSTTTGSQ